VADAGDARAATGADGGGLDEDGEAAGNDGDCAVCDGEDDDGNEDDGNEGDDDGDEDDGDVDGAGGLAATFARVAGGTGSACAGATGFAGGRV
jgi:hypothetical protein